MKKEIRLSGLTDESIKKLDELADKMGVPTGTYAKMVIFNHLKDQPKKPDFSK